MFICCYFYLMRYNISINESEDLNMIDKDLTTEEFIHLFGLETLDDNELNMIKSLLYSINISTRKSIFQKPLMKHNTLLLLCITKIIYF